MSERHVLCQSDHGVLTEMEYVGLCSATVLIFFSGMCFIEISYGCSPCLCQRDIRYGGVLANCSNRNLSNIPTSLPDNITILDLFNNNIMKMTIEDFQRFSELRCLNLSKDSLTNIEEAPDTVFKKLEYLDISWNLDLGFSEVVHMTSWIGNSSIKHFLANYIMTLKGQVVPIDGHACRFLSQTNLREIQINGNAFSYFGKGVLRTLPKSLEIISARHTMLGDFDISNFSYIVMFENLKILDFTALTTWNPSNGNIHPWHETSFPKYVLGIPSLEVFRYGETYLKADIEEVHLIPAKNNLTILDFSNNLLTSVTGPLTGFENLQNVDFSNNNIHKISVQLFNSSNRIVYLNLSTNSLGNYLESDVYGNTFRQFYHLKVADITNNRIVFLPRHIFQGLVNLEHLIISDNFLTSFQVDIKHMDSLRELDLRNNKLDKLTPDVTEQLDLLPKVKVNLKDNPLSCNCGSLEFLIWMSRNRDSLLGSYNQTCILPNRSKVYLDNLSEVLDDLKMLCKSNFVLISSVSSSVIGILVLVLGFLAYRHRWKLKYLYYAGRRRYHKVKTTDEEREYRFDVFVSYADSDRTFVKENMIKELEDKTGLKLCIHHRDFLPGAPITENIISAIQNSRKTVLVLSPAFIKSDWCIFEFNMARHEGISCKLNNIVIVLYEDINLNNVPKDLAVMMSNNSYLEYTRDVYGDLMFWQNLTDGIRAVQHLDV